MIWNFLFIMDYKKIISIFLKYDEKLIIKKYRNPKKYSVILLVSLVVSEFFMKFY